MGSHHFQSQLPMGPRHLPLTLSLLLSLRCLHHDPPGAGNWEDFSLLFQAGGAGGSLTGKCTARAPRPSSSKMRLWDCSVPVERSEVVPGQLENMDPDLDEVITPVKMDAHLHQPTPLQTEVPAQYRRLP